MRAVFLDRDGTINREVDNLYDVRQLHLLPRAAQAIREFNKLDFLVIVVSNQPVVARGWLTEEGLNKIHEVLLERLARNGAKVDAIYYCPHHPEANLRKYRINCHCRKPGIELIQKAVKDFKIDMSNSFFIGDTTRDILTGKRAGLKTILVKTGYAGKDGGYRAEADAKAKDLSEAVIIIKKWLRE